MRQIILDTETTGLNVTDGHRLIEIGCLEMVNRKLTGERFHVYINPQREVEKGALDVHGITNEFLADKPYFPLIVKDFVDFVKDAELIIHNAPFDVSFINHELNLADPKWGQISDYCRVVDTLTMARQLHVGQRNSLDALCKRYGVDNSNRDFHGALLDASLLAQVYLHMTGGQGTLFEEVVASETVAATKKRIKKMSAEPQKQRTKLRVIEPTAEELVQHALKIQELKKKGKCLWEPESSQ